MRVVLVDASEVFRLGLKELFAVQRPELEIVDELACVDARRIAGASPDALIVDANARNADRTVLSGDLGALLPEMRVVVLCTRATPAIARWALRAGARGYLPKTEPAERILAALEERPFGSKVGGGCPAEMVRIARRLGLIPPRSPGGEARRPNTGLRGWGTDRSQLM
jgi:DNA-binding NarL/FixJ family response regulator